MTSATKTIAKCETCGVELTHKAGPQKPRWCDEHRAEGQRVYYQEKERRRRARARVRAARVPAAYCSECKTRLREPSDDGLCGFCQVELTAATCDAERVG